MVDTVYKFKKDDPEYLNKRRQHLVQLTKDRYKHDEVFRSKCKERAKAYYQKLKSYVASDH